MIPERQYDEIHNEGGEGYNPIRAAREEREWKEEVARPKSQEEIKYNLLRKLNALDCASARESGTYDQAEIDELRTQVRAIDDAQKAQFLAEWTPEITGNRRGEWNARVRKAEFGHPGSGKVDWSAVRTAEQNQGWSLADLKKAIEIHKNGGVK